MTRLLSRDFLALMELFLRHWLTLPALPILNLAAMLTALMSRKTCSLQRLPPIFLRGRCLFLLEELTARSLAGEKTLTLASRLLPLISRRHYTLRSAFANTLQQAIALPAQMSWLVATLKAVTLRHTQQQSVLKSFLARLTASGVTTVLICVQKFFPPQPTRCLEINTSEFCLSLVWLA